MRFLPTVSTLVITWLWFGHGEVDFIPRVMCPANYVPLGEGCYSFELEPLIWDDAQAVCQSNDLSAGELLVLETRNEAELITYYLQQNYEGNCTALPRGIVFGGKRSYLDAAWIGAVKAEAVGDFTYHWLDASTGDEVYATSGINWKAGAPQCTEFACAAYLECAVEYQWGDEFRYAEIEGFICEHDAL
ncbi:unnamed protein product [Cyprideis torosa]|uniref:Uncharacterized protein n=1 Tax=Cyprideis torosa TaxID=163714 RepID=A0A7R8WFT0_9CRUS|nr:unnamed protein product [Cyprideis torosa]CAG0891275.1 unnamed protein product [Cyprideis torosa]